MRDKVILKLTLDHEIAYSLQIVKDCSPLIWDSFDIKMVHEYYTLTRLHVNRLIEGNYSGIVYWKDTAAAYKERLSCGRHNAYYKAAVITYYQYFEKSMVLKTESGRKNRIEKIFEEIKLESALYPEIIKEYISKIYSSFAVGGEMELIRQLQNDATYIYQKYKIK